MAIYHLSVKTISRSAGRSATAAAAYRAGVEILDERTGDMHDYTRKGGIECAELVLPAHAPAWATDRAALWNAAEQAEKRKNSTVAREFEIALPSELSAEERRRLALGFAREIVERHGSAVDVAIHAPGREGDSRNHHAHLLTSTRRLTVEGFAEKTRELDDRKTGEVERWRARFAELQNERLRANGIEAQVDHRTLEAQGIERDPTRHLGPAATGYERRTGESSRKRLDFEQEVRERLERAREQGELERQNKALGASILDLSGNLEAAQAERERLHKREEAAREFARQAAEKFKAEQLEKKRQAEKEQAMREVAQWSERLERQKQEIAEREQAEQLRQHRADQAFAFKTQEPQEVVKAYPELAIVYTVIAAIERKVSAEDLTQAQREVVMLQVRHNLAQGIERGQLPTMPKEEIEKNRREQLKAARLERERQREVEFAAQVKEASKLQARWAAEMASERAQYLQELTQQAHAKVIEDMAEHRAHLEAKPFLFGRRQWEQQREILEHRHHINRLSWGRLRDGEYPFVDHEKKAVQEAIEQRVRHKNPDLAPRMPWVQETLAIEQRKQEEARRQLQIEEIRRDREREQKRDRSRDRGMSL